MDDARRGFLLGVTAYALWGAFPLFWPLLEPSGAVEILAHRIVWSVVVMGLLVVALGRGPALRALVRDRRTVLLLVVAAITITSGAANTTYTQNMVWHRDAITFVSPKQELPGGMDMAYQASLADEGGVSLRFVRGYDITNNKFVSRFDILWGAAVTLPNFAVRRTH